jgi:hypothetical protein
MPLSNALIPTTPANHDSEALRSASRANADFIAHLIATIAQAPQTRARRRADPERAIAAYRELDQCPLISGRVLSRSL